MCHRYLLLCLCFANIFISFSYCSLFIFTIRTPCRFLTVVRVASASSFTLTQPLALGIEQAILASTVVADLVFYTFLFVLEGARGCGYYPCLPLLHALACSQRNLVKCRTKGLFPAIIKMNPFKLLHRPYALLLKFYWVNMSYNKITCCSSRPKYTISHRFLSQNFHLYPGALIKSYFNAAHYPIRSTIK